MRTRVPSRRRCTRTRSHTWCTVNSPCPTAGGAGGRRPTSGIGDPAAVLDLADDLPPVRPDHQQAGAARVHDGVDDQLLHRGAQVLRACPRSCPRPARSRARTAGRCWGRWWAPITSTSASGGAGAGGWSNQAASGDGVGVGRAVPALAVRGEGGVGAGGVGEPLAVEPPHVVGAQDVGGRLGQRHVDQRLVLGAGRVLVVGAPRPDRLADDPHPPARRARARTP